MYYVFSVSKNVLFFWAFQLYSVSRSRKGGEENLLWAGLEPGKFGVTKSLGGLVDILSLVRIIYDTCGCFNTAAHTFIKGVDNPMLDYM